LYGVCQLINVPEQFERKFKNKSILPASLVETIAVDPSMNIIAKPGADLATVFDIVYDGLASISNTDRLNNASIPNPATRLLGDNFQFTNFGVSTSPSNYIYRQTCAGTALAALTAKLDVPFASLKTQMNAESKINSELILLKANKFTSPIQKILDSNQRPEKLSLLFGLWSKWTLPTSALNTIKNPQYLTGFQGMLVSLSAQSLSSYGVNGSAEAGYALPLFSVSGSGRVEYSKTTNITLASPDMLFDTVKINSKDEPILFFESVPNPEYISKFAEEISPSIEGRGELLAGNFYTEIATISGIPENFYAIQICGK
jgi:hypothetical protein